MARFKALLGFFVRRSLEGILVKLSIGIGVVTTLAMMALAVAAARRGDGLQAPAIAGVAASALAWGAGILLAFSVAAHAMIRDRDDGIRMILSLRGMTIASYVRARIVSLMVILAVVCVGGTLLTGLVAVGASRSIASALASLQGTAAACAHATAFALMVGALSMAALAARSRAGGYLFLFGVLFLPELVAPLTAAILPPLARDLVSVPRILDLLHDSLMPGHMSALGFVRGIAGVGVVTAIGWVLTRTQVPLTANRRA